MKLFIIIILSLLITINLNIQAQTIQSDDFYLSFKVEGKWRISKSFGKNKSTLTTIKGRLKLIYDQYGGFPKNPKSFFDRYLKRLKPNKHSLIKYTKEMLGHEGQIHKEYYASGYGIYKGKRRGFLLASFFIDNTNCMVLILSDVKHFKKNLPVMKKILRL